MFYSFDLTIPPSTSESAPAELLVELTPGTIERVDVIFPWGHWGLTHTRALHAAHPLWPSNPDADLTGDDVTISWAEDWPLDRAPFALRLLGWSDDTFFSHTVTWRFLLRPQARVEEARTREGLIPRIAEILGIR